MNLKLLNIIACSFLVLTINPAFATNNLFVNVDESTKERAQALNDEYLVQKLYFTKNHKFLLLNPKALEKDKMTLSFFNDKEHQFEIKERTFNYNGYYVWKGYNEKKKNTLLEALGVNDESDIPDDKRALYDVAKLSTALDIAAGNVKSFIDADGNTVHRKNGSTIDVDMTIAANANPIITTTASFDFQDTVGGLRYSLDPLPNTPEVHLLTIADDSKTFAVLDGGMSDEKKNKEKSYEKYLKDKGYGHLVKKVTDEDVRKSIKDTVRKEMLAIKDERKRKKMYKVLARRLEHVEHFSKKDLDDLWSEAEKHHKKKDK